MLMVKFEAGKAEDHGLHDPVSTCADQLVTALQQETTNKIKCLIFLTVNFRSLLNVQSKECEIHVHEIFYTLPPCSVKALF